MTSTASTGETSTPIREETGAASAPVARAGLGQALRNYVEVLKPRETALLTFIGVAGAIIAAGGRPALDLLLLVFAAVGLGSAGCNGLTNYLDRDVDALMQRTRHRPIPSQRIWPPERMLPVAAALVLIGLALAWYFNPAAFAVGLVGTIASLIWRKMAITHLMGGISGCAPVLLAWLAIDPDLNPAVVFLCLLIAIWVPLHVWSLMTAYRDDYLQAGVRMFPLSLSPLSSTRLLFLLAVLLWAVSIGLYLTGYFGWLYLAGALVLGATMVWASFPLLKGNIAGRAWRIYKLSAFPYLGLIFLVMMVDLWV
ncbi:MAG: protoheme IX farnesyltransferase [Chloroflexi bacterium]|nr:protoheme IX farnesyltransferase [Chloroflexota bacterium]